jgi:primosomal protein N' (replication factor Y)
MSPLRSAHFADIAVPLPLPAPLTYALPEGIDRLTRVGARARVQVGKRKLTGVVVEVHDRPPAGITVRPVEEIVDREPILPEELLSLARFVADYYLTPLGEVLRAFLPADLPAWENPTVSLTQKGAFAEARSAVEAEIIEVLRERGSLRRLELEGAVVLAGGAGGGAAFGAAFAALAETGRLAVDDDRARSSRYVAAVELAPGTLAAHLEAAGRSEPGRAAVEHLAALARPATVAEVAASVGCTPAVIRRLVGRGVLRQFSQVASLSLDRHLLAGDGREAPIVLRGDQEEAVSALAAAVESCRYAPFLLHGMTGSGKTEVYLRAAQRCLEAGRTVVLLVPEIALVPALAGELERRFGADLALLHSSLSGGERFQEWERVRRGEARLVVGPRSALLAPLQDIGLIVVDEEQDSSYKQDIAPRYNARDLALVRGKRAEATVVLVSATPSLESRQNAATGKLQPLLLSQRVGFGRLPEPILVDLRQGEGSRSPGEVHFSPRLREEIAATLERGEQVILLRNRRGYSPALLCRACGEDLRCEDCGLPRTYHRRAGRLLCHYCGSTLPVPAQCPSCGEEAFEPIGAGTERVEETFGELFPGVRTDVLDRDALRRPGGVPAILERFGRGDVQVLIGTQMVSKGHHFPGVSLTAVLAADAYLRFPDFRAVERTYNLLTQFAGRAGRGERAGKVVIQTYQPDHYAIRAALAADDEGFAREELRFRRVFHYPPYTRMVQLLLRDRKRERAEAAARDLYRALVSHRLAAGVRLAGPAPAPFERLRGAWRFQILARSADGARLHRLVRECLPRTTGVDLVVDVDPQHLL